MAPDEPTEVPPNFITSVLDNFCAIIFSFGFCFAIWR
jgi:hypothetical protein